MSLQELGAHASVGGSILCERTTKLDMGHGGPPTQHYLDLRHWSSPAELRGSLPLFVPPTPNVPNAVHAGKPHVLLLVSWKNLNTVTLARALDRSITRIWHFPLHLGWHRLRISVQCLRQGTRYRTHIGQRS